MAQEEEKIKAEGEATEEARDSESSGETSERKVNPEAKVKREVKKIVAELKEDVGAKLRELGKQAEDLSHDEFREGLEQLTLDEIESYLRRIRDVASKVDPEERKEILQQEAEVRAIEQDVVRRRVEGTNVAGELTLEAHVFGNFEKFLGTEGVTIQTVPGTEGIEVSITDDGQKIVKVPEPSLENMIQVARQLNLGEFSPEVAGGISQFAEDLKLAAVMLDDHVFGLEATAVLYNAGYQLEQLINDPTAQEVKKIDDTNELAAILHDTSWQSAAKDNARTSRVFLDLFMGQHNLADTSQKTLYNTYFKRWQEQKVFQEVVSQDSIYQSLTSQLDQGSGEEQDQLRQQILERRKTLLTEGLDSYAQEKSLPERQKEYNDWLSDPTHQTEVFALMRRFIEKSLKPGEKGTKAIKEQVLSQELYEKVLDPWNLLVRNTEGKFGKTPKEAQVYLSEKLQGKLPADGIEAFGLAHVLTIINDEFIPQNKAASLDYVPAHLTEKLTPDKRDAVACIIAIAYEKKVLEEILGEQYLVLPEIAGNHATLLVIDAEGQIAFRLDPSIPKNEEGKSIELLGRDDPFVSSIYDQLGDFYGEIADVKTRPHSKDTGDTTFEIKVDDKSPRQLEISLQAKDADGAVRTVMSGDSLISSVLLSNMAALGDNTYFQAGSAEELHQAQLDAVENALRIVPQNAIAQDVKKALLDKKPAEEIVTTKRKQKEPIKLFPEAKLDAQHLVGAWNYPPGPIPAGIPPEVTNTIQMVSDALDHISPGTTDLKQLPTDVLENAANLLGDEQKKAVANVDLFNYITRGFRELNKEFARRQNAQYSSREDTIFSGSLSPREQGIFLGTDTAEMKKFISRLVYNFGWKFDPGFALPPNATSIIQGKLDDIQKTLQVNRNLASIPELQVVLDEAERESRLPYAVSGAFNTEQGNPRALEQAQGQLSNMDSEGGHGVALLLSEMHDGRPRMIAEEYGRRMEQVRQEKKRLGVLEETVITSNEYKDIRLKIIEDQLHLALDVGVGRYVSEIALAEEEAGENHVKLINSQRPSQPLTPAEEATEIARYLHTQQGENDKREILRKYITSDANFASTLFIIDGRASSYIIRGDDAAVYDGTSNTGVDQQYKDNIRYGMMTEARKKLLHILETSRAEFYIELRWGRKLMEQMKKQGVLDQFVRLNNIELIAPQVDKYWEGQFIRIRPMLYSINKWKSKYQGEATVNDPESDPARQYALGLRTLWGGDHDPLISGAREGIDTSDPLLVRIYQKYVGEGPNGEKGEKEGEKANWGTDRQAMYKKQTVKYGMMMDYMSQFYQDELIKPFAYEHDLWNNQWDPKANGGKGAWKNEGNRLDPRFVAFFTGRRTDFLDHFGVDTSLQGDARAQARFKVFQDKFGSTMAAIRSYNMNGIDPNLTPEQRHLIEINGVDNERPPHRREQPLQTDFGARRFDDIAKLGQGIAGLERVDVGDEFRKMMAEMTQVLRRQDGGGHNMGIQNRAGATNNLIGRLAYDPLLDHVLRQSPLVVADVPYWMLHGKDPYGNDHPYSIQISFGGSNQFARWYEDQKTLAKGREDFLKLITDGNVNQLDETMLKPLNEGVMTAVKGYKGLAPAAEVLGSIGGKLLEMKIAHRAELLGLERTVFMGMSGRSAMRELFGLRSEGWAQEDAKMRYWTQMDSALVAAVYRDMTRRLIEGDLAKKLGRSFFKILYSILLLTLLEAMTTGTQAFQEDLKAA